MLDLVPGHTSHRHPWFQESAHDPDDHRYIWSDRVGAPVRDWIPNQGARGGYYLANFYPIQPALNFGYARTNDAEPWRQPVDAAAPQANRAALREIMAYWFDRGVAGFRVDMAASLVKDDPGHVETAKLWGRDARVAGHRVSRTGCCWPSGGTPRRRYRRACTPTSSCTSSAAACARCGTTAPAARARGPPTSRATSTRRGAGSMREFLAAWQQADRAIDGDGFVALPTANHDFSRLACGPRTRDMVAPAFAFQLTWPTLPVDLLRRRDRHAVRAGAAGQGGQPARRRGAAGLAHAHAVGRVDQLRFLRRLPRRPVPADRPGGAPAADGLRLPARTARRCCTTCAG